jgi:histidine triad (HIT) family protein
VAPGHLLVVPRVHVADATTDPEVTAEVFAAAAELARDLRPCNLITSCGEAATQSVFHLHVHLVPRREGDGLALPWTGTGKPA